MSIQRKQLSTIPIATLLRTVRIKAGLTQEERVASARITREHVNQLKADKKSPTVQVLLRLCRGMDLSAGKLLMRVEGAGRPR